MINEVAVLHNRQLSAILPFCTESSLWLRQCWLVLNRCDAGDDGIGHHDDLLSACGGEVPHVLLGGIPAGRLQSFAFLLSLDFLL